MIYSHGNAETLFQIEDYITDIFMYKLPVNVIAYGKPPFLLKYNSQEYTGYDQIDESNFQEEKQKLPTEETLYQDITDVYQYARNELKIESKRLIALGVSLGSGPSCYLAEKH